MQFQYSRFLHSYFSRINATHEERMAALVEDGIALAVGTFSIFGIGMLLSIVSVAMVNWSALKQVCIIIESTANWSP